LHLVFNLLVERRALPPGANVVVGVETVELMPVGSGDLFGIFISEEVGILGYRERQAATGLRVVATMIISASGG